MPIRYTTEDPRSDEQVKADDVIRADVERTGGAWAQMTEEQREQLLIRIRDKKQRAQAVARLEELVAQLVR